MLVNLLFLKWLKGIGWGCPPSASADDAGWPSKSGETTTEVLPGKEVEQRVKTGVGGGQTEGHDHRLLHDDDLVTGGVFTTHEMQVQCALDVVRHEADQERRRDNDDHADGLDACGALLLLRAVGAAQECPCDARVAQHYHQEGDQEAHHQGEVIESHQLAKATATATVRWLKALGLIGLRVHMLTLHQER